MALLLCITVQLGAQEAGLPAFPDSAGSDVGALKGFYFKEGEKGTIVYTQIIRWEGDPYALKYWIVIRDAAGAALVDKKTLEPQLEVQLAPGEYEYSIVTYNLLGKPEARTDWLPLRVLLAEEPEIESISPDALFIDSLDSRVTVKGSRLLDGCRVFMEGASSNFEGKEIGRTRDEEVVVVFPDKAYRIGNYSIRVENPCGLTGTCKETLRIRFQRPVDILGSLGFSPFITLYDAWFLENWSDVFNPLGFDAQLAVFFIKASWGLAGAEVQAQVRRLKGGDPGAVITSDYLLTGVNLLYKYRFTRRFHGLVRLGGGLSLSDHGFDYNGFAGPETTSVDPFIRAGFAVQYFLPSKLYFELGTDWSSVFLLNHAEGGVSPFLRVGYQLY